MGRGRRRHQDHVGQRPRLGAEDDPAREPGQPTRRLHQEVGGDRSHGKGMDLPDPVHGRGLEEAGGDGAEGHGRHLGTRR